MPLEEERLDVVRAEWQPGTIYTSTVKYFEGELSGPEYRAARRVLATSLFAAENDRTCLLLGYGSQPYRTYALLSSHPDVEVLWDGPFLPRPLWPLTLFVACHGGLLLVKCSAAVKPALHVLSYRAMVELFSFSSDLTNDVRQHVQRRRWRSRIGPIIGNDPTYFSFGVERDHPHSETGIYAWCSFGSECPAQLQALPSIGVAG